MWMDNGEQTIYYCLHGHPLVLVEAQGDENEKALCSVCREVIISASTFSCVHCNFHLHPECAQIPSSITPHPLHPQHYGLFLYPLPEWLYGGRACAMCKETCKFRFYSCYDCVDKFYLCTKCSVSSWNLIGRENKSKYEFKGDGHQLPFIFLQNHKDELKTACCSWCLESLMGPIYVSVGCKIKLHSKCFHNLPTETAHPCHRLHTLFLHFRENNFFCEVCQKNDSDNLLYRCLACKFDIHLECIRSRPIIEANRNHEHQFSLLFRNDPFVCDACGTIGRFVSYVCHTCHLQVHKSCTSLPRKIKAARHDDVLVHKYFLEKGEDGDCQICFERVKKEYGCYGCSKEGCNFVVHVKCVLEDDSLYTIIDQENGDRDDATDSSSSIRVIKVNELGEATEVRHFNHEHDLVLGDKIKGDEDRACDGCMLPISTPFYYCSRCDFFLHKTCAELPKTKHHWFQLHAITLEAGDWEVCRLCYRWCSGLFYSNIRGHMFCLRCAAVPYTIKNEGHQHVLFFDRKCKGKCNGCGHNHRYFGAFRCKECSFSLDFACITLPLEVGHKCDRHLLKLSNEDGEDDPEQFRCDVCEKKRDAYRLYYSCSTCDNSVHSRCALGGYPFLKDGAAFNRNYHFHHHKDFNYVRKVVDGYPYCSRCGKPCQDEVVKCTECDYIIHFDSRAGERCPWGYEGILGHIYT
ncbi:uncharacterized protein LOC120173151 [Hibiscus syriacus]|uniref:uncharacterized protein LOC120173151 n=1 Tax=Hibiscus syriacus TaxID=106335 RepID=UPI0019212D6D|nr:uncharacterized protein LOC120173151 [Hibiscus syriacus]